MFTEDIGITFECCLVVGLDIYSVIVCWSKKEQIETGTKNIEPLVD